MFLNVSENAVITSKGPDQQADLCKKIFSKNIDFNFDVGTLRALIAIQSSIEV